MAKDFRFTVITAFYNSEKYLRESIESVINQDIGFSENVQLILVDDGSSDKSGEIASEYKNQYPENILVLTKENGGVASARNLGLKHAEGEYINFLDSDDKLSSNALSAVNEFIIGNDVEIVALPLKFFGRRDGDHYLNYKFEQERIIDLNKDFDYPHAHISSTFIRHDLFKDYQFDTGLVNGSDMVMMNQILLDVKRYGVVNRAQYNYRKRSDGTSIMDNASKSKRFFTEKIRLAYKHLIDVSLKKEGEVLKFIQYLIALDINGIITSPIYEDVLTDKNEIDEFCDCLNDVFSYIDEDIIKNHRYLKNDIKLFYNYIKNQEDFNIVARPNKNKLFLKANEFIINKVHNHKLHLTSIDYENSLLNISGFFASNCKNEALNIKAQLTSKSGSITEIIADFIDEKYCVKKTKRFLAIDWKFFYNFKLQIPVDNNEYVLKLFVDYNENGQEVIMNSKINFKPDAGLSPEDNYFVKDSKIILFKDNAIFIANDSFKNKIRLKLK